MSAENNIAIVQGCYAAFARGDIAHVLAQIAEDCAEFSVISATKTAVPWHLNGRGKADAARFFEVMGKSVEYTSFEPRDYAASGDHVYATVSMQMRIRATGETVDLPEVIHHFVLKNGLVVRWRASEDTKQTHETFVRSR